MLSRITPRINFGVKIHMVGGQMRRWYLKYVGLCLNFPTSQESIPKDQIYIYISQYITYILAQGHKRLKSKFKHNLAERSNIRKYGQVITIKHLDQKKNHN